jgi:hypothetical protein
MSFWKQFAVCLGVIAAGFAGWVFFVPGAADTLRNAGVPESIVGKAVDPDKVTTATPAIVVRVAAMVLGAVGAMVRCLWSRRPWWRALSTTGSVRSEQAMPFAPSW